MAISKKKIAKKLASKKFIKEQRETMLAKCGYNALKEKHGKSKGVAFPDYTVESKHPLSNKIPINGLKNKSGAHHPDAKQFPVGNDHKSGLRLIVATDDLKFMAGKKT